MELKQYLRSILTIKLIPLVRKNQCEVYNNIDNLEVHHVKRFSIILEETLQELNLEYKDIKVYNENQLKLITNIILGKHLQIEYLTLCENCHAEIHLIEDGGTYNIGEGFKLHYEKLKFIKEIYNKNKVEELKKYLPTIINKKLFRDDKKELVNKVNLKDLRGRDQKSITLLNKYLDNNKINYTIISLATKDKNKSIRYWKIIKNI